MSIFYFLNSILSMSNSMACPECCLQFAASEIPAGNDPKCPRCGARLSRSSATTAVQDHQRERILRLPPRAAPGDRRGCGPAAPPDELATTGDAPPVTRPPVKLPPLRLPRSAPRPAPTASGSRSSSDEASASDSTAPAPPKSLPEDQKTPQPPVEETRHPPPQPQPARAGLGAILLSMFAAQPALAWGAVVAVAVTLGVALFLVKSGAKAPGQAGNPLPRTSQPPTNQFRTARFLVTSPPARSQGPAATLAPADAARQMNQELFEAASRGDARKVQQLLSRGANVNARSSIESLTPLHVAVMKNAMPVVVLLLDRGAEIDAQDDSGRRALEVAKSRGLVEMQAFLRSRGAREVFVGEPASVPSARTGSPASPRPPASRRDNTQPAEFSVPVSPLPLPDAAGETTLPKSVQADQPTPPVEADASLAQRGAPVPTWTGVWKLAGAATRLTFFQTNETVKGFFDEGKGSISGRVSGRTLNANWQLQRARGDFSLTLSGADEFRGSSRNYSTRGAFGGRTVVWEGTRVRDSSKSSPSQVSAPETPDMQTDSSDAPK